MDERTSRIGSSVGDSLAEVLPLDELAERIHPQVLESLARWRDIDAHSISQIDAALHTSSGVFAGDSIGYLSALHGYVAEQLAAGQLGQVADVVLPQSTNVEAIDIYINGVPYQIKEGTNAYEQAHIALERFPNVRHFITDPATADQLDAEGIDAIGLPQLEPQHIATITGDSVTGLDALDRAGAMHVPVLTAALSLCRYWEAYYAERLDGRTALARGATDVAAQAIGVAAGMKLAAILVVGTGIIGSAAIPLTAGAILGALGLRTAIANARARGLREAERDFNLHREVAEEAALIFVQRSRSYGQSAIAEARARIERDANDRAAHWKRKYEILLGRMLDALTALSRDAIEAFGREHDGDEYREAGRALAEACALADASERYDAIFTLTSALLARTMLSTDLYDRIQRFGALSRELNADLAVARSQMETGALQTREQRLRQLRIDLIADYALLVEQLARAAKPVVEAIERMRVEGERLGAAVQA